MSTISTRIKQYLNLKGVSQADFASNINRSVGWVNNAGKSLKHEQVRLIQKHYPDLNTEWLMTGKGEMIQPLKPTLIQQQKDFEVIDEPMFEGDIIRNKHGLEYMENKNGGFRVRVPIVPFPAYASFIEAFDDDCLNHREFETTYFDVDHVGRGKYVAFRVTNDSMDYDGRGYTPSGAEILGRELQRQHWKDFRPSKYGFVLVTKSGIMFKDIIENIDDNGDILLHSRNPSPEYSDFKFPINDVHSIYKVIKRTF